MYRVYSLMIVLFAFSIGFLQKAVQESADTQIVTATGLGAIISTDLAKAEDDALSAAFRKALEQVMGLMVESEVLVKNYQVVEDNIYSKTSGYIRKYEIIDKKVRSDNTLEITIRAEVAKTDLLQDLDAIGLLITRKGKPRLMVVVDEYNMGEYYPFWSVDLNTSTNSIMSVLMEKGFPFVEQSRVLKNVRKDAVLAALQGDTPSARAIAENVGAEMLIIGKAISKAASNVPSVIRDAGMVSCQSTINLRAIRASDGIVLATATQQASAAHIDKIAGGTQALQKAATLAAEELAQKILKNWQEETSTGNMVQLRIIDLPGYLEFVRIKNTIKNNVRSVNKIYQREYSGNSALLDIETGLSAISFADELAGKDFSPYRLKIVDVSGNKIVIKVEIREK